MKYKNNPFNIRCGSHWFGMSGQKNGFCEFSDIIFGVRAALYLVLRSYPKHGAITISNVIARWAPLSDGNDTDNYISYVTDLHGRADGIHQLVFNRHELISYLDLSQLYILFARMARMETGYDLSYSVFYTAYLKLKNAYYEKEN